MSEPIRNVDVQPTGDDQEFKRDQMRVITELIARLTAAESKIAALEGRTN